MVNFHRDVLLFRTQLNEKYFGNRQIENVQTHTRGVEGKKKRERAGKGCEIERSEKEAGREEEEGGRILGRDSEAGRDRKEKHRRTD